MTQGDILLLARIPPGQRRAPSIPCGGRTVPTILLSEALKKTPKEREAIIDDPDCDIIDDRQGVPIQALSQEGGRRSVKAPAL